MRLTIVLCAFIVATTILYIDLPATSSPYRFVRGYESCYTPYYDGT